MGPKCPLVVPVCHPSHPREKGRKERETLQQIAEVTREGFRLKKILIEEWKKAREEKQVRGPWRQPRMIWILRSRNMNWGGWIGLTPAPNEWCPAASYCLCFGLLVYRAFSHWLSCYQMDSVWHWRLPRPQVSD